MWVVLIVLIHLHKEDALMLTSVRYSYPRPAPHCRVLPLYKFNGTIPEPLPVYSEVS